MAVAIEAHVVQYGKLLRRDGGGIADSREHAITSFSLACPREIVESEANPIRWLPGVGFPQNAIPSMPGQAVYGARRLSEGRRRWLLFTSISQRPEHGTHGRNFVRSRTLALAAADAERLWWLPFGVLPYLVFQDDFESDAAEARQSREKVCIRQPDDAAAIEAGEPIREVLHQKFAVYIANKLQLGTSIPGLSLVESMQTHKPETIAWGIGLASKNSGVPILTDYLFGVSANERGVAKSYRITFTVE